ncbi:hypothetical protein AB0L05_31330 [Nonomuraea pusilla]|uniref:hypothetical protein n=1 Tax=Nonomuraea pusilla TaxID=46177 RepID=UPI0033242A4C
MPEEIIEHYKQLLATHEWLAWGSLGWTVCRTDRAAPEIDELAQALSSSGEADVKEMAVAEEPLQTPGQVVFFEQLNDGYFLFESEESYVSENAILKSLSVGGRVYNISWNGGYHSRLAYAEDGEIRLRWLNVQSGEFPRPRITHPIDEKISLAVEISRREGREFGFADLMAVVELATGVRLSNDWVDGVHPCLVISDPLPSVGWPYG